MPRETFPPKVDALVDAAAALAATQVRTVWERRTAVCRLCLSEAKETSVVDQIEHAAECPVGQVQRAIVALQAPATRSRR